MRRLIELIRHVRLIAIMLLIAAVMSFALWRWQLRREINGRLAAIHAKGLPTNWAEMAIWPTTVADSENAAFIYTNAIAQMVPDGITDNYRFKLPSRGQLLSDATRAQINGAIQTNHFALATVYSAVKQRNSRYPVNYMEGPGAKVPHLAGLKRIATLLECDAISKADAGDAVGTAEAISASFSAAQSLEGEPLLLSQLTGNSLLGMSCQSLERALGRIPLTDEWLAKLSAQIIGSETTNRMLTGLIGDRALYNEFLRLAQDDVRQMVSIANRSASEGEKTDMPSRNPGIGWKFLGFWERDRNFFLRGMETNILIASIGPPASMSLTNETQKLESQAMNGYYFFSSLVLPGISHTAKGDAYSHANLRVALVALAIERWRGIHQDEIPDSLDLLVPSFLPSIPVDPYDGKPLRFKRLARGYVVYSVGPNLQDDAGKEKPPHSAKVPRDQLDRYDITFTVER